MYRISFIFILCVLAAATAFGERTETLLKHWDFSRDSVKWESVRIPHDWAITGPFDRSHDLQLVAVEQNGETEETWKTGRTGGLPYMGRGYYTTRFEIADTTDMKYTLVFDGAMSNPQVEVNGRSIGGWVYGYNSFYLDVPSDILKIGENTLTVSLENKERSSRWYPGAGLYRNVRLVATSRLHIPVWGTYLTTPYVSENEASVRLAIKIEGADKGAKIWVDTRILDSSGKQVACNSCYYYAQGQDFIQDFLISQPSLWSVAKPTMYSAVTTLSIDGRVMDTYTTPFGIRRLEYLPEKGFFVNGESTKFRGVCLHHDLGPLGAAVSKAALQHQITLLKDIGVNAIRTSHNMPAPELVELCDEMGMMLMIEPFDDWSFHPKSLNGYGSIFKEWAEKDMVNMLHQYRNHPSVVIWSIGNEVPSQWGPDGVQELVFLQDICHREDPTRPVTCGMDQAMAVLYNGFAAALDIPGFNYKPHFYKEAYNILPQKILFGAETASTVSSRGFYAFPLQIDADLMHQEHQSSSYDTEFCFWSNIPDLDFAADEDYPWLIGQFVWTGFDYIGEPSPYDTDAWPSHTSLFGIYDLASLPKDRAWLYRSVWQKDSPTLHVLPHWTWPGREGQATPVMVYTSWPQAELFVNNVSQGIRQKQDGKFILPEDKTGENHYPVKSNREALDRYRLVWDDVVYEPGEIRVVAYDDNGNKMDEEIVRTAGKPHHLILTPNRSALDADGEDLLYVTVQVADKDGNIVPVDSRLVEFQVKGAGSFRAAANGDPTSLDAFQEPRMHLFNGAATAIVESADNPGVVTLVAKAKGVKPATITIPVK